MTEVISVLRTAPYNAAIDLAYQLNVMGRVLLSIVRDKNTTKEQRDVCLKQAMKLYGDAFKALLSRPNLNRVFLPESCFQGTSDSQRYVTSPDESHAKPP